MAIISLEQAQADLVPFTTSSSVRCYFVTRSNLPIYKPKANGERATIDEVSDPAFLEKASENTRDIYQGILWEVERRQAPVIEVYEVEGTREMRVVIGYKQGGTNHYFSSLSDLYHFYGLYSTRKYVEQFSNGITVICESPVLLPCFSV